MKKKIPRKVQSEQTRSDILDTAIEFLKVKPFSKITVEEICRAANSSVGSFYHYFPSKDDLFRAVYIRHDQKVARLWESQSFESPVDELRFLIVQQLYGTAQYGATYAAHYFALALIESGASQNNVFADEQFTNFFPKTLLHTITSLCQEKSPGLDPQVVTNDILRSTRGVIFDWSLKGGSYDIFSVGRHHLDVILKFYGLL